MTPWKLADDRKVRNIQRFLSGDIEKHRIDIDIPWGAGE